jgi:uncharacterized membrane protein YidH (DUF202 family)
MSSNEDFLALLRTSLAFSSTGIGLVVSVKFTDEEAVERAVTAAAVVLTPGLLDFETKYFSKLSKSLT